MTDFEVYVDDMRYAVPTLHLITAASEARAIEMAERLWRDSEHHLGVELRCEDKVLFVAGSRAERAASACS